MGSKPNGGSPSKIEIEFEIQSIPLADATRLTAAGGGKYSALAHQLIERFATRDPEETFAFGTPGQEVPHSTRNAIMASLTSALSKAGIPWRVSYSIQNKLFVVLPRKGKPGIKIVPAPAQPTIMLNHRLSIPQLAYITSKIFGISVAELKGPSRVRKISTARFAFIGAAKKMRINGHNVMTFLGRSHKSFDSSVYDAVHRHATALKSLIEAINSNGGGSVNEVLTKADTLSDWRTGKTKERPSRR